MYMRRCVHAVCVYVCVHNLAVKESMLQSLLALKAAQSKRKLENLTNNGYHWVLAFISGASWRLSWPP